MGLEKEETVITIHPVKKIDGVAGELGEIVARVSEDKDKERRKRD